MKIKYLFYIGVATLALSGCNDGFLERAPEAINDKTFWNTTGDLETYANQFYSYLPGGVTSIADGESDNQVPNSIPQFFWNQLSTPAEAASWCNWSKGGWQADPAGKLLPDPLSDGKRQGVGNQPICSRSPLLQSDAICRIDENVRRYPLAG